MANPHFQIKPLPPICLTSPPPPPRPKKKIFFRPTRFHQFWISKAPVSYEESGGGRGERVGSNYGGWVYTMHGSNRYLIPHIFYFLYNPVPYFESKYQPTPQKNFMDPTRQPKRGERLIFTTQSLQEFLVLIWLISKK